VLKQNEYIQREPSQQFLTLLWFAHYELPVDKKDEGVELCAITIRGQIFNGPWYETYEFIEFVLQNLELLPGMEVDQFRRACNHWLERDMSAWRIVGDKVARVTSEEEIAAIEEATNISDEYAPVATHIRRALELMSDRTKPDHRNSIKESISAVESICAIVTQKPKATLGDTLKQLEANGVNIHPALRGAFNQMYGYTSDANGIRHALLNETNLDFEDAKFMLVSCSAFVNLLRARTPYPAAGTSTGQPRSRAKAKPPQTPP
jgi:hypothetical protein